MVKKSLGQYLESGLHEKVSLLDYVVKRSLRLCVTSVFNMWIEDFLVPELKPGQTVILDNATFHKSEKTKKLIENAGCNVIFLPPYSPDLNPIETFWANLKKKIKSLIAKFHTLQQAIDAAFKMYLIQSN